MKNYIFALTILLFTFTSAAQNYKPIPGTYSFSTKLFGNEGSKEAKYPDMTKSYFLILDKNNIIWCMETGDGFLFPAGFGYYDNTGSKLVFKKSKSPYDRLNFYRDGDVEFKLRVNKDGNILLLSDNENVDMYFGDSKGEWINLTKEKYTIKPSSKLVGKRYTRTEDKSSPDSYLYFKSATEVEIGKETPKTFGYICIGNCIAIPAGNNPTHEIWVGTIIGEGLSAISLNTSGLLVFQPQNGQNNVGIYKLQKNK